MLTAIILDTYSQKLPETIKSLAALNCPVLIGNTGLSETNVIARHHGASTVDIDLRFDYSEAKNALASHAGTPWVLYLEPWEALVAGTSDIHQAISQNSDSFHIKIIQSNVLTKEIRLWKPKLHVFQNPVFESIVNDEAPCLSSIVYGKPPADHGRRLRLTQEWIERRPTDSQAHYYHAFALLGEKKYEQFLHTAQKYLFLEKTGKSVVMLKYYIAMVELYVLGDTGKSVRNILQCISCQPLMAEFWCLLGDIYYKLLKYEKAMVFYENAMILGSRRLNNDLWPIEIPKYKDYPQKLMASCETILKESKLYQLKNNI